MTRQEIIRYIVERPALLRRLHYSPAALMDLDDAPLAQLAYRAADIIEDPDIAAEFAAWAYEAAA